MSRWQTAVAAGVLTASLDDPPRNFLTFDALEELGSIVADAQGDEDVRCILLRSALPGRFITHADLDELASLTAGAPPPGARHWVTAFRAIETSTIPVVATVDGTAGGGGVELLLTATIRLASPRATFRLPETLLGMIPGAGGTQRLPRLVGRGRAAEMILTGREIPADEALAIGLVDRVLPAEGFDDHTREVARRIARRPRAVIQAAMASLDDATGRPAVEHLRAEGARFAETIRSDEGRALVDTARRWYADADGDDDLPYDTVLDQR